MRSVRVVVALFVGVGAGCNFVPSAGDVGGSGSGSTRGVFNNTTDPTNNSANYVTSKACSACHPGIAAQHVVHGHAHKLTRILGGPPEFPPQGLRAGVPDPPDGFDWSDISWVIGGYTRKARFIDNDGFVLTTGLTGVDTQWNLSFPPNGTTPGFTAYKPDADAPKPYDFSCFVCHTTGPLPLDEASPRFQENRPGLIGTWQEPGVQCEACHGPGGNHIPNPANRDIFVDSRASNCGRCHTRGDDPQVIQASGGYIRHHEQWPELLASGAHSGFDCIMCHAPHASANYDRDNAIRNDCTACHSEQDMAIHEGKTFVRGLYVEPLTCESCHMTFATKSATAAGVDVVGPRGRMGDVRTHIFRIDPQRTRYTQMFTADGGAVMKDSAGRAGLSLDFVCLRCHNGIGIAPAFTSVSILSDVATHMHGKVLSVVSKRLAEQGGIAATSGP